MAGVTDGVFRRLAWEQGPALAWTEMISAQALLYDNDRTWQMATPLNGEGVGSGSIIWQRTGIHGPGGTKGSCTKASGHRY